MSFLSLQGVGKRHGTVIALQGVDLDVAAGARLAILGPSGSGKSTLLRLVAGFDVPDEGRIILGSTVLAEGREAMPAHRRGIGYVAQDGALFPHLSAGENVAFGLPRRAPDRERIVTDLFRLVDLDPALGRRRPDALSGGQQQRVALARALAQRPRLILLDEPFSALDAGLRAATRDGVSDILRNAGITTILVTHDRAEALSFADQIAVIRDGRLLQVASPREVYVRPRTRAVAELIGDAIILAATVTDGVATCVLGAVAVAKGTQNGAAAVAIRPEQVMLEPIGPDATRSGSGSTGRIVAARFGGPQSTLTIELGVRRSDALAHELVLTLPTASLSDLAIGSEVAVTVSGTVATVLNDVEAGRVVTTGHSPFSRAEPP